MMSQKHRTFMAQVRSSLLRQKSGTNLMLSLGAVLGEMPPQTPRHNLSQPVGCGYHIFAGKECARALALMSLKPEDCNSDITDLDESKIKILDDWQKVRSVICCSRRARCPFRILRKLVSCIACPKGEPCSCWLHLQHAAEA